MKWFPGARWGWYQLQCSLLGWGRFQCNAEELLINVANIWGFIPSIAEQYLQSCDLMCRPTNYITHAYSILPPAQARPKMPYINTSRHIYIYIQHLTCKQLILNYIIKLLTDTLTCLQQLCMVYSVGNGMKVCFSKHCFRCFLIVAWLNVIAAGSRWNARAAVIAIENSPQPFPPFCF